MMQQQNIQQEPCGNQQQLQQPMMLCPVQYVYDTSLMLPQRQEHQLQQNQIIINVKNPPPWIQNRSQNQVIYVQQLPNQYQPYIQHQMIQSPTYHPQMSYQMHPMLPQDNRQFVQIPNIAHFNTAQNPTAQIQQQINDENDKMPLLTQMLNQKGNAQNVNKTNVNFVRPTTTNVIAATNVTPTANIMRPVMQNQQVQTDIPANTKGRPRNVPPQIITINPMQQRPYLANQKQDIQINLRPTANLIRGDVPQHIKTKIPSSISVKTVNRSILPRPMIRPFEVMPAPQNFYYSPIIMTTPSTETNVKNTMTNTGSSHIKPSIQEINSRAIAPMQIAVPMSNVPPVIKMESKNAGKMANSNKQIENINSTAKPINNRSSTESTTRNTEIQTQTDEKLVRNTVFVQARGRILNEKQIVQNPNLKRTNDNRLKEENQVNNDTIKNSGNSKEPEHSANKYIKVESTDSQPIKLPVNSLASNTPVSIQTQQSRISNLQMNADFGKIPILNKFEEDKTNNAALESDIKKSEAVVVQKENITKLKDSVDIKASDMFADKDKPNIQDKISINKSSDKETNKFVLKEHTKDVEEKEEKVVVLTHVLEGYIIQESNVAFTVQKPTRTEKEVKKEWGSETKTQELTKPAQSTEQEDNTNEKSESKNHSSWRCLNKSIESEKEMEFAVIEKDDPFANIKKSAVESWTADQVSSHLQKYEWTETASKLLEEEIDGESILLVNKDQLLVIGVSDAHADRIVAFAAS